MPSSSPSLFARLSRPALLLLTALTYLLGAGIVRYLGFPYRPLFFWLGMAWVLLTALVTGWLVEVFRPLTDPFFDGETRLQRERIRRQLLLASGVALIFLSAITALFLLNGQRSLLFWIVLLLTLILSLAYGLPPLRLIYTGWGELIQALILGNLTPMLAYLLQTDYLHRLLPAAIFPLTLLMLSYFLALGFPSYAADRKYNRLTLVQRTGWQNALVFQRIFLLLPYLLIAALPLLGFPLSLFWPVFLTLPLVLLQIYWFSRISVGAPPHWNFFNALALTIPGLTVYLLTLTFWIN